MGSSWSEQQENRRERKEKDRTRREKLASFFFNLAQLAFAGLVIGWISPLSDNSEPTLNFAVLGGGLVFTIVFASIGNNILR